MCVVCRCLLLMTVVCVCCCFDVLFCCKCRKFLCWLLIMVGCLFRVVVVRCLMLIDFPCGSLDVGLCV